MFTVTGTYNGRPTTIRWVEPGDIFGDPEVPLPLLVASMSQELFMFTAPDGWLRVRPADPFSVWAYTVRLLDDPVTDQQPPPPAEWPQRPTRLARYVA